MKPVTQESDFRVSKILKDNNGNAIERNHIEEEQLPLPLFNCGQEPQSSSPEFYFDQPQGQLHEHPHELIRSIRLLETSQFEIEYRLSMDSNYRLEVLEYDQFKSMVPMLFIRFMEYIFLNTPNQEGIDFMVPSIDQYLNIRIIREALLKKDYADLVVYPQIESISISDN